jgi:hypothetical protein
LGVADTQPPPGLITGDGVLAAAGLVLLSVDALKSSSQARHLSVPEPETHAAAPTLTLMPLISSARLPDGSHVSVLGLGGRF